MQDSIWIAELRISDRTARKLTGVHHIEPDLVRELLVAVSGLSFTWHDHEERGRRVIVAAYHEGKRMLVVLYPVDHPMDDVWELGSAYHH